MAFLYSTEHPTEAHSIVNKKLFNWLREIFHDPPYLYELYKLMEDQAQLAMLNHDVYKYPCPSLPPPPPKKKKLVRDRLLWRRDEERSHPPHAPPPSPTAPPLPPAPLADDDDAPPWIYFPKGGDGGSSLSDWLSGSGAGSRGAQVADHGCNSSSSNNNGSASLPSGLLGNCTGQWLMEIVQNGTVGPGAAGGERGGGRGGGGGGGGGGDGEPSEEWPDWYRNFGGNFTFYDYDYDSSAKLYCGRVPKLV
ncbi:hypothetical protein EGW08_016576 [Elysia chlorotica]|uniref:Uncharacterized protein n=1 Tax=Elysia chlorotica TaxID=188477 RepID=A0A3S1B5T7_ELYCH|nr:hypothetical protein EGW08_016576 [Elysia chlorotica]